MNYNKLTKQELLYILQDKIKIGNMTDAVKYIRESVNISLNVEHFGILFLSADTSIIAHKILFKGGIDRAVIDPCVIFRTALKKDRCKSIIIFHNHPSGNPQPSNDDIETTRKLLTGAKYTGISVTDHIIITETESFSFSSAGMII